MHVLPAIDVAPRPKPLYTTKEGRDRLEIILVPLYEITHKTPSEQIE